MCPSVAFLTSSGCVRYSWTSVFLHLGTQRAYHYSPVVDASSIMLNLVNDVFPLPKCLFFPSNKARFPLFCDSENVWSYTSNQKLLNRLLLQHPDSQRWAGPECREMFSGHWGGNEAESELARRLRSPEPNQMWELQGKERWAELESQQPAFASETWAIWNQWIAGREISPAKEAD